MKLSVAERLFCEDGAGAGIDFEIVIAEGPGDGFAVLLGFKLVE